MAFVGATGHVLARRSAFGGERAQCTTPSRPVSGVRMGGLTDKERKSFAKVGGTSSWRENFFTGGFPGGEAAFNNWLDKGMTSEVPDLPDYLQPTTKFEESKDSRKKPSVLERVTAIEFFSKFKGKKTEEPAASEDKADADAAAEPSDTDAPPEALYEKYFPAATRNLAPMITITYEKDFNKDKVGVAMAEVVADPSQLYFPREYSGMAPFIDIQYDGSNLANAKVGVRMAKVEPLPTIAPPVPAGETVTKLVPGNSGGLKLEFEVAGEGPVNVYSDPRCIENFQKMTQ